MSTKLKETAEQVSARLRLAERGLGEYGAAAQSAAAAHAQALAAKAKELNEKHQILQRGRSAVSEVSSTVSGALDKAGPPGEAVKSAATFTRGLFQRAAGGAGDLLNAAKAKVDAMSAANAMAPGAEAQPGSDVAQAAAEPAAS